MLSETETIIFHYNLREEFFYVTDLALIVDGFIINEKIHIADVFQKS